MSIETFSEDGFTPLFHGKTVDGWRSVPRVQSWRYPGGEHIQEYLDKLNMKIPPNAEKYLARWYVEDGVIIGEQETATYGGYLDFIKTGKWADWNSFRIRCVGGALPTVTTWINGLKIAELSLETLSWPDYHPKDVANVLGPSGHIAFEVHDNDSWMGEATSQFM
ncbi:hypothetical protein QQX98_000049 [Neonectria punicea]|uniref:3-keto-alpha-glucoside-1,2-lyase/3-keto-2-hydroxy-glucal hydratase domain-containing protein n=1 Tax=Neonectria punicea TaxID=979145 RepID=A0ABR1HW84_9HYPO